jgi:hypothetical protein
VERWSEHWLSGGVDMTPEKSRTISTGTLTGLSFMHKYRFLTVAQFAKIANFSHYHAADVLRSLERWGHIGYFGYTGIPGHGKTPKVYYLKRKGWEMLCSESPEFDELSSAFTEVSKETTWTPQMYHRLKIIDNMISLEIAIRLRPHITMVKAFLEYRMIKRGTTVARETTDFVSHEEVSENKLVPDAAFILENLETQKRRLYFLEMDMGTERIVSQSLRDNRHTLQYKFSQYDRYLVSRRYAQSYAAYGEFRSFTMIFISLSGERIDNIRREIQDLPQNLVGYYRFATFDAAMGDFLGPIWKSRLISDTMEYSLVR